MVFIKYYKGNKKVPETIRNMSEPIRTIFYQLWWRNNRTVNNSLVSVIGMTGSGKSILCLYFCYKLDPEFSIDNIIFDPKELVEKLSTSKKKTAYIFEEAEINLSSKSHWSDINQIIVKLFSTIRYRGNYLFMNLPSEKQLDSHARALRFANVTMNGIFEDSKGMYSSFKWDFLTPPMITDAKSRDNVIKREPLVVFNKNDDGIVVKRVINEFRFRLPKDPKFKELVTQYEQKKKEFLDVLYKDLAKQLKNISKKNKEINLKDVLNAVMKNRDKFFINGKYSKLEIQSAFELNKTQTQEIIRELKQREKPTKTPKQKEKEHEIKVNEIKKFMGL